MAKPANGHLYTVTDAFVQRVDAACQGGYLRHGGEAVSQLRNAAKSGQMVGARFYHSIERAVKRFEKHNKPTQGA